MEASLRRLLLDPEFWRPRLERLEKVPRHMVIFPVPQLVRPGIDACELRLRAHDEARLRALLVRPAFCQEGGRIQLRPCERADVDDVDWECIDKGGTDVVFAYPDDRRLEDRVLDVVRLARAACCMESVDCSHLGFGNGLESIPDELVIAEWLRNEGWIAGRPGPNGPQ